MKIFISGGCKNGKSYYAQHLAKGQQKVGPLYYIATMKAVDPEDDARIAKHREEREGWGFTTVEQGRDIEAVLDACDHDGSFLLDSLTALLANEMFSPKEPMSPEETICASAVQKVAEGLLAILNKVPNIVIVSDYIYSDAFAFDPFTEEYRKSLAALDCLAAKHCDVVLEVCHTQVILHKGRDVFYAALKELS